MELKNQIEAILFSAGKKVTYEELSGLCNIPIPEIKKTLQEMKREYEEKGSSLLLTEEADGWKLTVKEKYLPIVQKLLPETELPKSILETLAVVAWKHPALQSEIIKIRTNKAYDHIKELEERGFITKEKKGRSYLIKVTQKFHEYFDIPNKEKLKEVFKDVKDIEEHQKKLGELEVYEAEEEKEIEEREKEEGKEHIDRLEVYKVEAEKEEAEEKEGIEGVEEISEEEREEKVEEEKEEIEKREEEKEIKEKEEISAEETKEPEVHEKVEEKERSEEERKLSKELEEFIEEEEEKKK